jgi:hypothetical protein
MELNFKELSYGNLISHTFPGLFLGLEIILAFKIFTPFDGFNFLYKIDYRVTNIIAILVIAYIFSTLLGIILDGIHHFIFRSKESWDYEVYKFIGSLEQLQIYKKCVDEDNWYYYEAYANIGIAMVPGIFLLPYWFYQLNLNIWFIITISFLYIVILIIIFYEAIACLKECYEIEKALIENFKRLKVNIID